MGKDYKNASTDASVNNQQFEEMRISEQTQQATSGEVALTAFNIADAKGVINAVAAKSIEVSLLSKVKTTSSMRVPLEKVLEMLRNDAAVKYKTERCRLAMQNGDDAEVE